MNWEAIKNIYIMTLKYKHKIEYFGNEKYILTLYYSNGQKHLEQEYKNTLMYHIKKYWDPSGNMYLYKNGICVGDVTGLFK